MVNDATSVIVPQMPAEVGNHDLGLGQWNILTVFRGSIAHGMYVPPADPKGVDDIDVVACCVPPASYYLGLREYGSRGTRDFFVGHWDVVVYEARKLIRLLAQGNPNVLSMLWVDERYIISSNPAGDLLRESRAIFVGKHVYDPFVGYARGQLKRMTHWQAEGRYKTGHMGAKRKRLVESFGYDIKSAAHLIRLLRMGIEFLECGELFVERIDDREELLAIKRGDWELQRVMELAEQLFRRAEIAYENSALPAGPSDAMVNNLCVDVVRTAQKRYGGAT